MLACIQGVGKTVLALVGWWTVFIYPSKPLVVQPFYDVINYPPPSYALQAEGVFCLVTFIDWYWHYHSHWTNNAHHSFALAGTIVSAACGGFGHLLICSTLILETVGPVYQLIKLRSHSLLIQTNIQALRCLAVGINLCIRASYFCWLGLSIIQLQYHALIGKHTISADVQMLCLLAFVNVCAGLILDRLWSKKLLRIISYTNQDQLADYPRARPRWITGISAILCFGTAACYTKSVLPAIVVVNSIHYHILHPSCPVAYYVDISYNLIMMSTHLITQLNIPMFVCASVSVAGWYLGEHHVTPYLPQYADVWHALTCHVPAAAGIMGTTTLFI
jgi:hypothetical protein